MLGRCVVAKQSVFRCLPPAATRASQQQQLGRQRMSVMAQANRVRAVEVPVKLEQGYTYLDVRTPEEFQAGRPKNSVNIPLMLRTAEGMQPNPRFLEDVKGSFPDTTTPLVVGCKSGNRSARAVALLSEEQYSDLVDNGCGFDGWVAANLPVDS